MSTQKSNITCPQCGKKNTWQESNSFRPFCSERCKLIDLGQWANEDYKLPGPTVDPHQTPDDKED